jgi:hypothetical protein
MAKLSTEDLLDAFKEMTLIELSEFVKKFEDTFEVTAAAPVMAVAGGAAAGADAQAEEEKDEFDVVLDRSVTRRSRSSRSCVGRFRSRAQGGQGPGRERAQGHPGEGSQGRRGEGQGLAGGRRRQRLAECDELTPLYRVGRGRTSVRPRPYPCLGPYRPGRDPVTGEVRPYPYPHPCPGGAVPVPGRVARCRAVEPAVVQRNRRRRGGGGGHRGLDSPSPDGGKGLTCIVRPAMLEVAGTTA